MGDEIQGLGLWLSSLEDVAGGSPDTHSLPDVPCSTSRRVFEDGLDEPPYFLDGGPETILGHQAAGGYGMTDVVSGSGQMNSIQSSLVVGGCLSMQGYGKSRSLEATLMIPKTQIDGLHHELLSDALKSSCGIALATNAEVGPSSSICRAPPDMKSTSYFETMSTALQGMHVYNRALEESLWKIAQVACSDETVMAKVGGLLPNGFCDFAKASMFEATAGMDVVVPPAMLEVVVDAIGVRCQHAVHDYTQMQTIVGAMHNPSCNYCSCSTNRFVQPVNDLVMTETNWILFEANQDQLSCEWYGANSDPARSMDGGLIKRFLTGAHEPGAEFVGAATNLLRSFEGTMGQWGAPVKLRHYVDPEWGTLVSSDMIKGESSLKAFCSPDPPYPPHMASLFMIPVFIRGRWSCFVVDIESKMVIVLDPNIPLATSEEVKFLETLSKRILAESLRCIRLIKKDSMVGTGVWGGKILLPTKRIMQRDGMLRSAVAVINCMFGFNWTYICADENDLDSPWARRKLVYLLIHMEGNRAYRSWLYERSRFQSEDRASANGGNMC